MKFSELTDYELEKIAPGWGKTHQDAIDQAYETQEVPVQYPEGYPGTFGLPTGPGFYGDGTESSLGIGSYSEDDVALRGFDGEVAEALLEKCIKHGGAIIDQVMQQAVTRALKTGTIVSRLWRPEEKAKIEATLMICMAAADLLGRASAHEKLPGNI